MKRFLLCVFALCAASTFAAQGSLPNADKLLNEQWDGDWRTIQYVLESSSGSLTVAIEKPGRLRAELKAREGWRLMVVSDGKSTWVYRSDLKQYGRFDGSRPPGAWLSRLDELLLRNMTGARDDVLTPQWRNLRTTRAESVRVSGVSRECWTVEASAVGLGGPWSTRTAWIDKNLLVPLQLTVMNAAGDEHLLARVNSLQVGRSIPDSTFMFTVPRGVTEVPVPSHLLSASSSSGLPDGRALWQQRWTGSWHTLQYTTEASSPLASSPSVRKLIRTSVMIEKPDNIRVEIQGLAGDIQAASFAGRTVTVVSDEEATWILNSATRQFAKISKSQQVFQPDPVLRAPESRATRLSYIPVLSNVEEWVAFQLLASYRIFNNPELFKDLREIREPILAPMLLGKTVTLRSEVIDVGEQKRDCWVVIGEVNNTVSSPLWGSRIAWIDKELQIPLLFGSLGNITWNTKVLEPTFPNPQRFDARDYEPDFAGTRVVSLKIDAPIPPGTFTFKPPKGAIEVTPSPWR